MSPTYVKVICAVLKLVRILHGLLHGGCLVYERVRARAHRYQYHTRVDAGSARRARELFVCDGQKPAKLAKIAILLALVRARCFPMAAVLRIIRRASARTPTLA